MKDHEHVATLVVLMDNPFVKKATRYVNKNKTIKLTRLSYGNKPTPKNAKRETFILTIGKPNCKEKEFINDCIKAKERFPVSRPQVKHFPSKKKK